MQLDQLLDQKTVRQYLASLKKQGLPRATLERKLASIRRFSAWVQPETPQQQVKIGSDPRVSWIPKGSDPTGIQKLYQRYSSSRISSYLHLAILVLFSATLAVFGYNQIFKEAFLGQAYPQAPSPATPNRYLSFQARLTDSSDNPITTPTDMRFIIYNNETASGSAKLWEELRYIDPDQDGIFSVTLGTEQSIASSIFSENVNLWLGVTVETDPEAAPRQRIATVGYALNAETLQGFPPSASASADQIPVLTQEGDLYLAAASPMVYSASGTFQINGQALSVVTASGTNGSITIAPDGTGQLLLSGSTTSQNFIRATDANLTSGHLISGYVGNDTATGDLLNLSSGAVEAEKFAVSRTGNTDMAGNLQVNGGSIGISTDTDLLGLALNTLTVNGTLNATTALQTGGTTRVDSSGNLANIGTTQFNSITYTWPSSQTTSYVLQTNGSGTLSWVDPAGAAAGAIPWVEGAGILYPKNSTVDLLVGGQATTSAKFAVLNMNTGTPVASISANSGNIATYITGDGTLATTNKQSLTIGNSSTYNTTGNVLINSNGTGKLAVGTTTPEVDIDMRERYINFGLNGGNTFLDNNTINFAYNSSGNSEGYINYTGYLGSTTQFRDFKIADGKQNVFATFDGSSASVGIGTTAPDAKLEINHATGDSLRLTYNDSDGSAANYTDFSLASDGDLTITPSGGTVNITGQCVTGDSLLSLADGTAIRIDQVKGGEEVMSLNETTGELEPQKIKGLLDMGIKPVFKLTTEDGKTIRTTGNHPYLTKTGWTKVSELKQGEEIAVAEELTSFNLESAGDNRQSQSDQKDAISNTGQIQELSVNHLSPFSKLNEKYNDSIPYEKNVSALSNSEGPITAAASQTTDMLAKKSENLFSWAVFREKSINPNIKQGVKFVKIATIEYAGEEQVWDIEVANTHNFIANGIVAHNTYISGNLTAADTTTFGGIAYTWPGSQTASYVLQTNGSGTLSWVDPAGAAASAIPWVEGAGILYPKNSTVDLLVGGQATTSAKFAVLNVNSGTPVASMSSTYLTSDGTLATTARQSLTIGNSSTYNTTGNVLINPNGTGRVGIGTTSPNSSLHVSGGDIRLPNNKKIYFDDTTNNYNYLHFNSGFLTLGYTADAIKFDMNASGTKTIEMVADSDFRILGNSNNDIYLTPQGTGDVLINSGNVGIGDVSPATHFVVGSDAGLSIANSAGNAYFAGAIEVDSTTTFGNIAYTWPGSQTAGYVLITNGSGTLSWSDPLTGPGTGWWRLNLGAISPINDTLDLLIGSSATTSAKFAVLNVNSGTPTASISGSVAGYGLFLTGDGTIATTLNRSLLLNPDGGNVGIAAAAPSEKLEVTGNIKLTSIGNQLIFVDDGYIKSSANNTVELQAGGTLDFKIADRVPAKFQYTDVFFYSGAVFNEDSADYDFRVEGNGDANLIFGDAGVDKVGIGTAGPDAKLDVLATSGEQLRLTYADATEYAGFTVDLSGNLAIAPQGNLTITTDGTGDAEVALPNDSIGPNEIFVTGQTDEYCLTYELTGTTWEWQTCGSGGGGSSNWRIASGAISPINDTLDLLVGSNATTSAKFAVINVNSGTPTATISANSGNNALFLTGLGNLGTTNMQTLTLGGATSGDVLIQPNADTGDYFRFASDGTNLTLATTDGSNLTLTPAGTLTLNSTGDMTLDSSTDIVLDADGADILFKDAGTTFATWSQTGGSLKLALENNRHLLVQSNAGGDALVQIDQLGSGDVIAASASGTTAFRIDTSGYVYSQRFVDLASSTYYLDPAATGTALNIAGDAVIGGGEVLFTPISTPTTTSEGNVYYDSDTNHLFVYTDYDGSAGWGRVALDMTKYTVNNSSVSNDSYIEIAHNQATNDLSLTGWVYDTITSLWKNISEYSHTIKHALQNEFDDASGESFDVDTNGTLLNNLNAYWTLNESSTGTTATTRNDSYGSNNLTDNNTTASGAGKKSNATDFEVTNSEFLEITDNTALSTGDIDFTISAWVNIESTGANRTIASRWDSATAAEYILYYNDSLSRFVFILYNSAGTSVCTAVANNLGAPSLATWYNVVAWHDATTNTCSIQANNGTANSASETGTVSDTTASFRIGAYATAEIAHWDGLIDEVGFWKKTLSTQEKTDLYNSGNGNSYTTHENLVRTQTALTSISLQPAIDVGTGADGSITVSGNTSINATNLISGRSCADGGDAVNYSVTTLTSITATLSTTPSTGCLAAGDEVLLINLQGTTSSQVNLGNYETLRVSSVSTNTITFKTAKTKYYGDNATDDTNIGTAAGTQKVMLQRVPNYSSVTVNSSINFYPTAWNGTKGGVMFFRATGTVSAVGNIHANSAGYRGGVGTQVAGEAFCANPGGGNGGTFSTNGANGSCGGGGGGGGNTASFSLGGTGSSSLGGAGGGGGAAGDATTGYAGAGAGGGHITAGLKGLGINAGANGGTSTSGNGGNGQAGSGGRGGGGGGGGTYGSTDTTKLEFGSGGGAGGQYTAGAQGNGGNGGGITFISANTITVTGTIASNGTNGNNSTADTSGCGGGGAGGSVKLASSTLNLGTNLVSSTGGSGGSGLCTFTGGAAGNGKTDIYYATSYSGSASSPTPTYTLSGYNTYGLYHSPVINTPNAATYESLRWETPVVPYGKIEFQTRSGATLSPTDGTWESWKPFTASTNYVDLNTANTHTDWQNAYTLNVADGDTTRNIDQFEDEDESTAGNTTKLTATGFETDTSATLTTSLISYWPLNESSTGVAQVNRSDTYSTNTLTDNGTTASGTGKKSNAADFESANSEFLEITDNASLSTGDIDFTVSAWVNLESKPANNMDYVSKWDSASQGEYVVRWTQSVDRFSFNIYNTSGSAVCAVNANNFGAPSLATWYHIIAWHDATANTCNIQVNNGTANSAAETGTATDGTASFRISAIATTEQNFFDGLVDEVGFWKKVLSTTEKTDLYNSGNANTYPENDQYAQASISSTDISNYDYLTAWVRASQTGSTVKVGFGETAATEQEETINIDTANTWQKVYWDLSDIQSLQRDAVTKLRFTNLYSGANTISIDNVRAERLLTNGNHAVVSSTPNDYFQYRIIFSTTNTAYQPQAENISLVYNDGYKVIQTDNNTVRLYNYSGSTQNLRLDAIIFGADLAEWYAADDPSIEPGDVVSITGQNDEYSVPKIKKSGVYADNNLMGIISTKAGLELGIAGDNRRLVGLKGRVPVKIAPDSPRILSGDYLTSSSTYPGRATKLVTPGQAVAKALEGWDPSTSLGTIAQPDKINSFINLSYHDPFDTADIFDRLNLELIGDRLYSLYSLASDITGDYAKAVIERAGAFSRLIAANIKAGLIETQEISTKIISPLPGEAIFIEGDASVSGTLVADRIVTNELIADRVRAGTIEGLRDKIEDIVANLDQPTAPSVVEGETIDINTLNAIYQLLENQEATNSAEYADLDFIEAEGAFFSDYLAVLGEATITNLSVAENLSLTRLSSPTGTIDLAGNFNVAGNLTVSGNVDILGELSAPTASFSSLLAQRLAAEEITTSQLIIAVDATVSAEIATNSASITTNATAGKAVLPGGSTELTINSPHVDASSLIYVTPTGDPQNQVLYVKAKALGQWFKVAINQTLPFDLEFNWWIIKLDERETI